jgi:hypothetical protein
MRTCLISGQQGITKELRPYPTGSGKTVIFELALVRLLWAHALQDNDFKAVYIAPIKVSVPPWQWPAASALVVWCGSLAVGRKPWFKDTSSRRVVCNTGVCVLHHSLPQRALQ